MLTYFLRFPGSSQEKGIPGRFFRSAKKVSSLTLPFRYDIFRHAYRYQYIVLVKFVSQFEDYGDGSG